MSEIRVSSLSLQNSTYETKNEWDCFCQGGTDGCVLSESGNYQTAFFEAFPRNPSCFVRGEGVTVADAEQQAWAKWQKIQTCNHEMERRQRTDGYAYCKHCSYSAMVFEPLTKCCICHKPTAYTQDSKGNSYCKKHARLIPRKNKKGWPILMSRMRRHPRKLKKTMKCGASMFFYHHRYGTVTTPNSKPHIFISAGSRLTALFSEQKRALINLGKRGVVYHSKEQEPIK